MIKYAANAFLAGKMTLITKIAVLCERTVADVKKVAKSTDFEGRIGNNFLHTWPRYGSSCFPRGASAFSRIGQEYDRLQSIVGAVIRVNSIVKLRVVEKLRNLCDDVYNGKAVAVLGAAFKSNTDERHGSASLIIIPALIGSDAEVRVVDPKVTVRVKSYYLAALGMTIMIQPIKMPIYSRSLQSGKHFAQLI